MAEGEAVINVETEDAANPEVEQKQETEISESNPETEQNESSELKEDTEMNESKSEEEPKTEAEGKEDESSSSPTSYRIPKLSEKSEDTVQVADEEEGIKLTVDEEHSDTELLVDETMEVQSEINNDSDKDKDAEDVNENGKDEKSQRKRSRSTSRSRNRTRSRSRSREKRRQDRFRDIKDTSSDNPDMVRSRVFVGHLDTDKVSKDEVQRLFSPYGRVIGVALHKGYGFVQYDNAESAKAAIKEAHGTPVEGMKIVVDKTVKLKKLLGEDPHSEAPLPKDAPRRRDRHDDHDSDYHRRRDMQQRYSRLEELERRMMYDRFERLPPPRRDSYYDSIYDRPPPPPPSSYMFNRPRFGDYERERGDRYAERDRFPERDRYPPPDPYYAERRREDLYGDYRGGSDPYRY